MKSLMRYITALPVSKNHFGICITVLQNYITEIRSGSVYKTQMRKNLYTYLADNGLVCEFADAENVILIPSLLNTDDDFNILLEMCKNIHSVSSVIQV